MEFAITVFQYTGAIVYVLLVALILLVLLFVIYAISRAIIRRTNAIVKALHNRRDVESINSVIQEYLSKGRVGAIEFLLHEQITAYLNDDYRLENYMLSCDCGHVDCKHASCHRDGIHIRNFEVGGENVKAFVQYNYKNETETAVILSRAEFDKLLKVAKHEHSN